MDHSARYRRRGRPPLKSAVRRDQRLVTFLTKRELNLLSALARENDETLSAAAHRLIGQGLAAEKPTLK